MVGSVWVKAHHIVHIKYGIFIVPQFYHNKAVKKKKQQKETLGGRLILRETQKDSEGSGTQREGRVEGKMRRSGAEGGRMSEGTRKTEKHLR